MMKCKKSREGTEVELTGRREETEGGEKQQTVFYVNVDPIKPTMLYVCVRVRVFIIAGTSVYKYL